jgi:hypothetical protein
MVILRHQFALEFHNRDGHPLGRVPIRPFWEPALEWNAFKVRRRVRLSVPLNPRRVSTIEPVAHASAGLPYCEGFRLTTALGEDWAVETLFSLPYFSEAAREASAGLVAAGRLKDGEYFYYKLLAFPGAEPEGLAPAFKVDQASSDAVPIESPLAPLEDQAARFGSLEAGDIPVFIPESVLAETSSRTEQAGASETGGVLIGYLQRDADRPDIAAVVTAQIPARHLESELASVTFTPDTWAAARSAITLRKAGEIMLGWWHSHPSKFWCSPNCPPESRRVCPLHAHFFSADDVRFHHAVFPKAYAVALVVTHTDEGLKQALFGWRAGLVRQRGFHILKTESRPIRAVEAVSATEKPTHAKTCEP